MFLTFELVFTILMLAAEKHKGTFLAPIGIGLALFIAELAGVYFTGGELPLNRTYLRFCLIISRRLPQPRTLLRPVYRPCTISIRALDLLVRSSPRRSLRRRTLPLRQDVGI